MYELVEYQFSTFLEKESMKRRHNGTTTKAPNLSKSSVSLEIAPILDQSPLYLHIYIKIPY